VTESGGRTALLGPAVLRLAEGVLLSVWRHGLLSPLDQLFSCALRARLRTRCQRLLHVCANMHHHSMQSSSGSEESRFFGLVHVGDATCVCRQRPRRRSSATRMQSSLASGASRDFFGLLRVGRRDFRLCSRQRRRICDACVRARWRLTRHGRFGCDCGSPDSECKCQCVMLGAHGAVSAECRVRLVCARPG
jgi:hypothetical protein